MNAEYDDTFDLPPDYTPTRVTREKTQDTQALSEAIMTSDGEVAMPGRAVAGSIVSNLLALGVGECFTKSVLVKNDVTMGTLQERINEWKHDLRQTANQAIRRAREHDNRVWSMESSQSVTPGGRVYVQIIVTRLS